MSIFAGKKTLHSPINLRWLSHNHSSFLLLFDQFPLNRSYRHRGAAIGWNFGIVGSMFFEAKLSWNGVGFNTRSQEDIEK